MTVYGETGPVTIRPFIVESICRWVVIRVAQLLVLTYTVPILVAGRRLNCASRAVEVSLGWIRIVLHYPIKLYFMRVC